jgi:hypothetical protein
MSDLETFALIGIVAAFTAAISVPQVSRVAPLSVINIFAMVSGLLFVSMGFLAFSTNWHEQYAWRSGLLIVTGCLMACYMMKRCARRHWQSGG